MSSFSHVVLTYCVCLFLMQIRLDFEEKTTIKVKNNNAIIYAV